MSDIFMSYVEEDSSVATQIGDGLQAAGYSTWLYERDSLPGIAYLLQTGEAITLSQAFVLIISPDSVVSNQVTAEVVRAHENNVPFFPLLHGITHLEFQESQPLWRQAIGAATSIAIDEGNIPALAERIVRALEAMGIQPSQAPKPVAETLEAPQPTAAKPSRNLPVQQTSFTGRESQIQEISDNSHLIDPLVSLTFALHSNPGAYAVLVGSGVSVGAGIPTGWQVVLDLISKVARVLGEDPGDDVARWYQERFGEEPDYGKLLDTLAKSPAERSALLRGYFEPTAEERARGVKVPGAAHKALAELAVIGHVQIFVTTNFDRLIEQALEAAGINPRVLSTPDSILGSPPLSQAGCTVVKLHGDSLDTRIKNTPAELDAYHESVDELLEGEFIKTNVTGTDLVIGAAHEMGLDPIVHVSSFVALIGTKGAILTPDSVPTTPPGAYYRSKADSDRVARGYQENGAPVVITYPGSVWGPNVPTWAKAVRTPKPSFTASGRRSPLVERRSAM